MIRDAAILWCMYMAGVVSGVFGMIAGLYMAGLIK